MSEKWGEGFVRWKEYLTVTITMIAVGGGLFGYVLNMHASQPHSDAVSHSHLDNMKERVDRQEERFEKSLSRIEGKVDDIFKEIREISK